MLLATLHGVGVIAKLYFVIFQHLKNQWSMSLRRVRLSVRHMPVLCLAEQMQNRRIVKYTTWQRHDSSFCQGVNANERAKWVG